MLDMEMRVMGLSGTDFRWTPVWSRMAEPVIEECNGKLSCDDSCELVTGHLVFWGS